MDLKDFDKQFEENFPALYSVVEHKDILGVSILSRLKDWIELYTNSKLKEQDDKLSAIRGVIDSDISNWNKVIFIKDLIK